MHENRISPRYETKGHARIQGIKTELLLRNLSITGCCLGCKKTIDSIQLHEIYEIEIKPEHEARIGRFDLQVECKWIRCRDNLSEFGFSVTASPRGKFFQHYVDYIDHYSR